MNIAEVNRKQSLNDKSRFIEIALGSALEYRQVTMRLTTIRTTIGKSTLKRVVSMLTRLIQRAQSGSEKRIEYEYRGAEYEYEPNQNSKI